MKYFDCHADTLTQVIKEGEALEKNTCDIDLHRIEKFADTYTQIFAIWKNRKEILPGMESSDFRKSYEKVMELLRKAENKIQLCTSAKEMEDAHQNGKAAAFLSVEDVSIMGKDVEQIRELGFLFVLLSWNYENEYACGAAFDQEQGLTDRGKDIVKFLLQQGIVLDISHLSDRGVEDLFQMTDKPIIASHSNVRALCNHPRNLKKEQIQELIRRKGLIGMNYYRNFVGGTEDIEAIIKHMDAVLNLGGEDVLVLGGDFDGCSGKFLDGIQGVQSMPVLRKAMLEHGFGEKLTEKVFFENARAFIGRNL